MMLDVIIYTAKHKKNCMFVLDKPGAIQMSRLLEALLLKLEEKCLFSFLTWLQLNVSCTALSKTL